MPVVIEASQSFRNAHEETATGGPSVFPEVLSNPVTPNSLMPESPKRQKTKGKLNDGKGVSATSHTAPPASTASPSTAAAAAGDWELLMSPQESMPLAEVVVADEED